MAFDADGDKWVFLFPHDRELLNGWWKPGWLNIHPSEGEPYDASGVPRDLVGFKGNARPTTGRSLSGIKPKELREAYKKLLRAGYSVVRGKKHIKVYEPDGGKLIVTGSVTGSQRAYKYLKTDCVRAGVPPEVFK